MSISKNSTDLSLVETRNEKVFATTLIVAQEFNKRHDNIIRKIDEGFSSKIQEILDFTHLNYEVSYYLDSSGKKNKTYLMTEDGFTEIAMSFTGEKSKLIRIRFLSAFRKAIAEIQRLREQRLTVEWQESRSKGKEIRSVLTSAIKTYEQHADKQGGWVKNRKTGEPTKPENRHYYSLISGEIYAQLFADRKLRAVRDKFDALQLQFLTICERACADEIKRLVDLDTEYHEIYQECKRRLTEMVEILSLTRITSTGINDIRLKWEIKEPRVTYKAQPRGLNC